MNGVQVFTSDSFIALLSFENFSDYMLYLLVLLYILHPGDIPPPLYVLH